MTAPALGPASSLASADGRQGGRSTWHPRPVRQNEPPAARTVAQLWRMAGSGVSSAASSNLRPGHDLRELLVVRVRITPAEVAADHAGLLFARGVVGAVEGAVAQRLELRRDPGVEGMERAQVPGEREEGRAVLARLQPPGWPVAAPAGVASQRPATRSAPAAATSYGSPAV